MSPKGKEWPHTLANTEVTFLGQILEIHPAFLSRTVGGWAPTLTQHVALLSGPGFGKRGGTGTVVNAATGRMEPDAEHSAKPKPRA